MSKKYINVKYFTEMKSDSVLMWHERQGNMYLGKHDLEMEKEKVISWD